VVVEGEEDLVQAVEHRATGELVDRGAGGAGDDERRADRPVRGGGHHLGAAIGRQQERDRARGDDLAVAQQLVVAGAGARGDEPADDVEVVVAVGQPGDGVVEGEARGLAQHHEQRSAVDAVVVHAGEGPPVAVGSSAEADGVGGEAGAGPERDRRVVLDLAVAGEQADGGGPDQRTGGEGLPHRVGDLAELAAVGARHEEDGHGGRIGQRLEDAPDDLPGGVGRQRVLRQRDDERHRCREVSPRPGAGRGRGPP
jgi:hypothetical protein